MTEVSKGSVRSNGLGLRLWRFLRNQCDHASQMRADVPDQRSSPDVEDEVLEPLECSVFASLRNQLRVRYGLLFGCHPMRRHKCFIFVSFV